MDTQKIDIMSFDKDKLNLINSDFNRLNNQLSKEKFLAVMNKHTEITNESQKIEYFEALIDAFDQIDVNGDGSMEWDEFSNFIVETGIAKQKKNFIDVIRSYHLSSSQVKLVYDSEVIKLVYSVKSKLLFYIESNSRRIKILSFNNNDQRKTRIIEKAHQSSIQTLEYIASKGILVSSGSDNVLKFWNTTKDFEVMTRLATREVQMVIKWSESTKTLITGGFDCGLNAYRNLDFDDNGNMKNGMRMISLKRQHIETISDILIIDKLNLIASSCYSGIINIWSLNYLEYKKRICKLEKGVLSLSCIEDKSLLLSAGFDHEVMIWDLVVGGNKVGALQGHSQSLISVITFPGTHQIISADISGVIKVWDNRTMSLVQTLSTPSSNTKKANCICVTSLSRKRIIVGSDQIYFYDYEESREGNLADSKSCISILFNEVFNQFVSAHIDSVKIWDASKGSLVKVFRSISQYELTFIKFDQRKRKLFIGDVDGNLKLINILNGVEMKYFSKHKDYISSMAYFSCEKDKRFISSSWDGFLKVHDDNTADEKGQLLSNITVSSQKKVNPCNSVDISNKLKILASGYDSGNILLNNLSSLASEGNLFNDYKINIISFLNELPCLLSVEDSGLMQFWIFYPLKPKKIVKEYTIDNRSLNENNKRELFPVKCICFEESNKILLSGDETGYLKAWDLSFLVDYLRLFEYDSKDMSGFYITLDSSPEYEKNFESLLKGTNQKLPISFNSLLNFKKSLDLTPKLIKEWKGHSDGVNSVCCFDDPFFFASSGQDCCIVIWNGSFERIGALTTLTDPTWNLRFDLEGEKKRKKQEAVEYYKLVNQPCFYEKIFSETEDEVVDVENKG